MYKAPHTLLTYTCMHLAKELQSSVTRCDAMDHNLPGSAVYGILQAIILHALLPEIFLTQGLNPHLWCLLNCQVGSLHWHPLESPLTYSRYSVMVIFSYYF